MQTGVPKEIKKQESRVGLVPYAVAEFVSYGRSVMVESGAGTGIGANDERYREAGASIVDSAEEIFTDADLMVKVKEPQPNEWKQPREGQILYTYLHLANDRNQTNGLIESGSTAIARAPHCNW